MSLIKDIEAFIAVVSQKEASRARRVAASKADFEMLRDAARLRKLRDALASPPADSPSP